MDYAINCIGGGVMTDIIDFNKKAAEKEPLIWQCNCGNCAFLIYENGDIECSDCDSIQNGIDVYQVVRKWTRKGKSKSEDISDPV